MLQTLLAFPQAKSTGCCNCAYWQVCRPAHLFPQLLLKGSSLVTKNRRHISDHVFTPSRWEVLRRNASTILVHRHSFDPSVEGGKQERETRVEIGGEKDEPNELTPQPPHTKVQPTDTITEAFLKNMYGLSRSSRGWPSTALSREVWPNFQVRRNGATREAARSRTPRASEASPSSGAPGPSRPAS